MAASHMPRSCPSQLQRESTRVFSTFRFYTLTLPLLSYLIEATGLEAFLFRKFLCIERTISHVMKDSEYIDDDDFRPIPCSVVVVFFTFFIFLTFPFFLPFFFCRIKAKYLCAKVRFNIDTCPCVLDIDIVTYLCLPHVPRSLHALDYHFI